MTLKEQAKIFAHMSSGRGTVPKNAPANWMIRICSTKVPPTTPSIRRLPRMWRKMLSVCSSRQLKALNSWNSVKSVNSTVLACSGAAPRKFHTCCARNTHEM